MDMGYARVNLTYQGGLDQLREALRGRRPFAEQSRRAVDARQGAMMPASAEPVVSAETAGWRRWRRGLILNGHDTWRFAGVCRRRTERWPGRLYCAALGLVTSRFGAWLDPAADKLLMLLCFVALLAVGAAPLWLVVLVVARDGAIALGWLLIKGMGLPMHQSGRCSWAKLRPWCRSSIFVAVLLLLAFDLDAPRLALAAAWACGLFVILSAAAYAGLFLRSLCAGRPMTS